MRKKKSSLKQIKNGYKRIRKTKNPAVKIVLLTILLVLSLCKAIGVIPEDLLTHGLRKPLFYSSEASQSTCILNPELISGYSGEDYIELNNNMPNFNTWDLEHIEGEHYSELDWLGRCGPAVACLHADMRPEKEREPIGHIKPSGWETVRYDDLIEDRYLYNRSHLIAFALTGQNDNEKNLITGTRYMNATSMLFFERMVMDFIADYDGHVLYRVTPYFVGNELVARGVEMEAYSVEDEGAGLCFHVFVYNYQPGIEIDYQTGKSRRK